MIVLTYTIIKEQRSRRAMQEAQHRAGRLLLCETLGCNEDELRGRLRYHENGKPYLPEGPFFSISHSGQLVLLAVDEEAEIGCDAEDLSRTVRNEEGIRQRILTLAPELADLEQDDIPLLELWVRFEAQLKAGGVGETVVLPVAEGYIAAVCSRAKNSGEIKIIQKYCEI